VPGEEWRSVATTRRPPWEWEWARESIGFVVGFLRLGLAEDGGQPHLIVIVAGRNEGEKAP